MTDWPTDLPSQFYAGVNQFNAQEFYVCHETLEAIWLADKSHVRELYQGVLQIAVGCFHLIVRHNWIGAVRKLDAGARRLERTGITEACDSYGIGRYGIAWAELITQTDCLERHLQELGIERVTEFSPALIPTIRISHHDL